MTADREAVLPRVSAVVLAWKAEPWLRRCVEALLASEKVACDVVLVDNGCTTDDVEVLERLPGVSVVRPGENLGFAGGCNAGASVATGEYLALVNGDAVVEPTTLARLAAEAARPEIGIAGGSVRLPDDPRLINSAGNPVHILGLTWAGRMGEPEEGTEPVDVAVASGACLLMRRALWEELGGFDPEYFAYHEDTELSMRVWRRGRRVVYVPDAVAVHRYEFSRNEFKFYLIERNRLMFLATLWGWRALLLLAPALLGLELAMVALAARQGWLGAKLRSWRWLLGRAGHIRRRRRLLQGERTLTDRQWMGLLTDQVSTSAIDLPAVVGPLNAVMRAYWRLVRPLV
ncbi:glycosyltransferase family 2 protein [Planosporangium mesophilum]|uniref:Glycosyl transferase n=1 Tax=Planosporangium mesophilum TaxID=689768 RepID=A0A8J3TJD1_9ACTN|nr:glycosyltransferase family 2 protein [Planosporangium mesophilum]NJC83062.1 glycosyltransferase family 2 protein [Planosporangium mesophilum]GII22470.1 glycosyl transferase [Planosporangium mesophilum]